MKVKVREIFDQKGSSSEAVVVGSEFKALIYAAPTIKFIGGGRASRSVATLTVDAIEWSCNAPDDLIAFRMLARVFARTFLLPTKSHSCVLSVRQFLDNSGTKRSATAEVRTVRLRIASIVLP